MPIVIEMEEDVEFLISVTMSSYAHVRWLLMQF